MVNFKAFGSALALGAIVFVANPSQSAIGNSALANQHDAAVLASVSSLPDSRNETTTTTTKTTTKTTTTTTTTTGEEVQF